MRNRKNLAEIIAIVKTKNPNIIIGLCEMIALPNMGAAYAAEFSKIITDLSTSTDVQFTPFF